MTSFPPGECPELLPGEGLELVPCESGEATLNEVIKRAPDAVVYWIGPNGWEDIGMLRLLRRLCPKVPLVVVVKESTLSLRRQIQMLRPIYYGVWPLEPGELAGAVRAAVQNRKEVGR
jgi:DNA-binding NarL/FixJ family response regulator